MEKRKRSAAGRVVLIAAALAALLWGCAAGPYGSLQRTPEVTRMFRENQAPEGFRYYVNGRSEMPYAIVGLDPAYRLEDRFWEPIAPNTPEFAARVRFIWEPRVWYRFETGRGAWIRGPEGETIGIWYSMYPDTSIVVEKDNRVIVHSPHRAGEENT
jgi:hypothetical protein